MTKSVLILPSDEMDMALAEKDTIIAKKDSIIAELRNTITEQGKTIAELQASFDAFKQQLENK